MPAGSAGSRERDRERERDKKSVFSIAFEASILSTSTDPSFSVSLLQAMPPPSSSAFSSSSSSHSSAAAAAAHDDLVARAVEAGISSHAELPPRVRALLPASEWRARCRGFLIRRGVAWGSSAAARGCCGEREYYEALVGHYLEAKRVREREALFGGREGQKEHEGQLKEKKKKTTKDKENSLQKMKKKWKKKKKKKRSTPITSPTSSPGSSA